jgi:hypothetical protein
MANKKASSNVLLFLSSILNVILLTSGLPLSSFGEKRKII